MLPVEEIRKRRSVSGEPHSAPESGTSASNVLPLSAKAAEGSTSDARLADAHRALLSLHRLLRSVRLYDESHPYVMQSLDEAYEAIRNVAGAQEGLQVRAERQGLVLPQLDALPVEDPRGELRALAADLLRAGIHSVTFARRFHIGELDTFAQLVRAMLLRLEESKRTGQAGWPARLREYRVEGISVNAQVERNVDTVLTSLVAALFAHGGTGSKEGADTPLLAPGTDDLEASLRLLAKLTPSLEAARGLAPEEAARAIHTVLEQSSRNTVRLLLGCVSQYPPQEGEKPQPYLLRISENLIFEFLGHEFSAGTLVASEVRPSFQQLADILVEAGGYSGPHSSSHLSAFATAWSQDAHREKLLERFWLELPPREKSAVLRGAEVWCMPIVVLQRTLTQLAGAGADAPRREARNILLNYARKLELEDGSARRSVIVGLNELTPAIESLWPNQIPDDLARTAMRAMEKEVLPEICALLTAFVETLSRIATNRGDYAGFETILNGLEESSAKNETTAALAERLVAQDRWLLLVDAAFANRALDPALPRLLQRDPERLLDRMTLLLTEPRGAEFLPAMARLLRAMGAPVLEALETRLYEARRQRVSAAIRLLATADPERLLRGLPRALASWEWNLQDLAVSELTRPSNAASARNAAFIFCAVLGDAHPYVAPMMLDHIGITQESTAVPQLMEIAAGEHEVLRDQFARIKAIEALGRIPAREAAELLRAIAKKKEGFGYAEPPGIRSAAEDALALVEDMPTSARVRAAFQSILTTAANYAIPRRYARIPLASPLRAHIGGAQMSLAKVRTIGLGGAYISLSGQEAAGPSTKLHVGDSVQIEIRSGLSKIQSTAVVRNAGPDGNGVEFVYMKDADREKLRKLVEKKLDV